MKIKISSKVALSSFLIAGLGIFTIAYLSFYQINGYFKENLLKHLSMEFKYDSNFINNKIDIIKNDILIISESKSFNSLIKLKKDDINYNGYKYQLENHFKVFMKQKESYLQVRFIGIKNNGKELVRVDRINNTITSIKSNSLQSKSSRYYFNKILKLKKGEIFISKIDLNRERGSIVYPIEPTIRVATPIFNKNDIIGFIIINADIDKLFNLKRYQNNVYRKTYLANSDGYYIYHPKKDKIFGFEFNKDIKLQNDFNIKELFTSTKEYINFYDKNDTAIIAKKILMGDKFIVIARSATNVFIKEQAREYINTILVYIILVSFLIAVCVLIFTKIAISPIENLTRKAKLVSNMKSQDSIKFNDFKTNDEIEDLAHSLETMVENLKSSQLKIRTKDELLAHQGKLAAMGEMVGAIAHQWRQPLNALAVQVQFIEDDFEDGLIDIEYLKKYKRENMQLVNFMSHTIDDFRNFFRIDKTKTIFSANANIKETVNIIKAQLDSNNIELSINNKTFNILGYRSEFQQVILNIINNAKDALIDKRIENGKIDIFIDFSNSIGTITILDNAKGIPNNYVHRIFEPYFTTKDEGKGIGIGLYMSKMIIEDHMNGKLSVSNDTKGASFKINLEVINNKESKNEQ